MRWHSPSPADTQAVGRALGETADAHGGVVILTGALGAGKTVFAKGVAEGLGIDPDHIASPTFVIANEWPAARGPRRFVHADFYRIDDALELEGAGLSDWLAGGTLFVAEWGEQHADALPEDRIEVRLEAAPDAAAVRVVEAEAAGQQASLHLERWRARCR